MKSRNSNQSSIPSIKAMPSIDFNDTNQLKQFIKFDVDLINK